MSSHRCILLFLLSATTSVLAQPYPYRPWGAGYYGGGGYGYGWGGGATPAGATATGYGNLIAAQGAYNQMTAAAMKDVQAAKSMALDNKLKSAQTYDEMRQINQRWVDDKKAREAAAYASNVPPPKRPRLTPSQLDPVTGHINWLPLLMNPAFAQYRAEIQVLFTQRAHDPSTVSYSAVRQLTDPMRDLLDTMHGQVETNEFFAARHFIDAVAEEARHSGFEDHAAVSVN